MFASAVRLLVRTLQYWALALLLLLSVPAFSQQSIVIFPAEGGEPRVFETEPRMNVGSPRWSPDGNWLAFDSSDNGRKVYVARLPDEDSNQLDFGDFQIDLSKALPDEPLRAFEVGRDAGMPSWSPDGAQLAWHTYRPGGVMVANVSMQTDIATGESAVDVSTPQRVARHWGNPVWLPTTNRLATIRGSEFSVYDPDTQRETSLHRPAHSPLWGYNFSPDGKRISYRVGSGALMIGNVGQSKQPDRQRLGPKVGYSSWSPDGKRIVVGWHAGDGGSYKLYIVEADSDKPPELLKGQLPDASYGQPDWSPDGKRIVCVRLR